MLWNGEHGHTNKEMPDESKTFEQVVHTQVENEQRIDVYLAFLLTAYWLQLLHQKTMQTKISS
jgi:hypothetical protein